MGLIITTNHKTDGIYLPADDRRHYVAWSDRSKEDFPQTTGTSCGAGTQDGGFDHVAAYLAELDLVASTQRHRRRRRAAFWDIVNANNSPEDAELADVLDILGNPDAVTLQQLIARRSGDHRMADGSQEPPSIPHRLERCGYVSVNPTQNTEVWVINGVRQEIYARAALSRTRSRQREGCSRTSKNSERSKSSDL